MFSLLCWNVRGYQSARPTLVAQFIAQTDADVVCLQEDVDEIMLFRDYHYVRVAHACAERVSDDFIDHVRAHERRQQDGKLLNGDQASPERNERQTLLNRKELHLCNSIYVKNVHIAHVSNPKTLYFDNSSVLYTKGMTSSIKERVVTRDIAGCDVRFVRRAAVASCNVRVVPRAAASCTYRGVTIANVHLCGGRHDDNLFAFLAHEKARQIAQVVSVMRPDIIVGDFNSENTTESALTTLHRYPLFENLDPNQKRAFLQYYLSAHRVLREQHYGAAFCTDDMRPTSVYGGCPDWIYVKNNNGVDVEGETANVEGESANDNSKKVKVVSIEKVVAIPHLSDHNAIKQTFFLIEK